MVKKIIALALLLAVAGGIFYWQYKKRQIVKGVVQDRVRSTTDSLYRVHYDSSYIDEVNGNATFYRVHFGVDSNELLKKYIGNDVPKFILKVTVDTVEARGIDVLGLTSSTRIEADSLRIIKPFVRVFQLDTSSHTLYTAKDTMELYRRMLGQFDQIHAKHIQIIEGALLLQSARDSTYALFTGINLTVHDFAVDGAHNYDNVPSYFVTNTTVSCNKITIRTAKQKTELNGITYDAGQRSMTATAIARESSTTKPWKIDRVSIRNLDTRAFVFDHVLAASDIDIGRCEVALHIRKKSANQEKKKLSLLLPTEIFELKVRRLTIGPSDVKLELVNKKAIQIPKLELSLADVDINADVEDIVAWLLEQKWKMKTTGEIVLPVNSKYYTFHLGSLDYDHATQKLLVSSFQIKPRYSEQTFRQIIRKQKDYYDLAFKEISISKLQLPALIHDTRVLIDSLTTNAVIRVANDRTLPVDSIKKAPYYPQHVLEKFAFPLRIRTVVINNGLIYYRERSALSKLPATLTFNKVNCTIRNISNMPPLPGEDNIVKVNVRASFLHGGVLHSSWKFPQGPPSSSIPFRITGSLQQMDITDLNEVTEPLALASFKKGRINKLSFDIRGTDKEASGRITFLYEGLKIQLVKPDSAGEMDKQGVKTLLANFLLRNSNPSGSKTRIADVQYQQDPYRSFFNLTWKTIFEGIKETTSKL